MRAIKIETIRVGDAHPGDVIRFTHPIDRGGSPRKSNWLRVTDTKLTIDNKVVLTIEAGNTASQKSFQSPYELIEVQVVAEPLPTQQPLGQPDTPDGPPKGASSIVEGHWRQDEAGQVHWVEPHVYDPEQGAEDLLEYMAGTDDDPEEEL